MKINLKRWGAVHVGLLSELSCNSSVYSVDLLTNNKNSISILCFDCHWTKNNDKSRSCALWHFRLLRKDSEQR